MRRQEFQPLDSAVIPRFAEPATFMRTPYVQSYAGLDIALVGVPFDLGSTNRAGSATQVMLPLSPGCSGK